MSDTSEVKNDVVTVDKFHWSDLYKKEDWLAVWIGFVVIVIAAFAVLLGKDGKAAFGLHCSGLSL